jgi:starvation-inducible DNA-binding protein
MKAHKEELKAHGSLRNKKEALDTYPASAYAQRPENGAWRHTAYLTAKPAATQISPASGSLPVDLSQARYGNRGCEVGTALLEWICTYWMNEFNHRQGVSMAIDIGISEEDRKSIVEGLSRLLSDTYVLYLKTHNFHWNVTGPMFRTLHLMFEEQYNELALAVDLIAERIRALGFPAPGAYATYARLSSIKEEEGVPNAEDMIRQLVAGQEAVTRTARGIFPLLDKVSDEPTADLLTQRMQVHEKTAWMLRALLEG